MKVAMKLKRKKNPLKKVIDDLDYEVILDIDWIVTNLTSKRVYIYLSCI